MPIMLAMVHTCVHAFLRQLPVEYTSSLGQGTIHVPGIRLRLCNARDLLRRRALSGLGDRARLDAHDYF